MNENLHTFRAWCAWPEPCSLHIMPILTPHAAAGQALELCQSKLIDTPCIEQTQLDENGIYMHTSNC